MIHHYEGDGTMQPVKVARLRAGGSILMSGIKYHWWVLRLACGHEVERRIRWTPIDNAPRGWSAQHRGVPLTRLPAEPTRARCKPER
jgi:hypothetical protein